MTEDEKESNEVSSDFAVILNKFEDLFVVGDYIFIAALILIRILVIMSYSIWQSVPVVSIMLILIAFELPLLIILGHKIGKYHARIFSYHRMSKEMPIYFRILEDVTAVPKYKLYVKLFTSLIISDIVSIIYLGVDHG